MAQYGDIRISDNMHGRLRKCQTCGELILVEECYNGVSHTMGQVASHWKCLTPEQQAAATTHYGFKLDHEE